MVPGVAAGLLLSGLAAVPLGAAPARAITLAEWAITQAFPTGTGLVPTGISYRPPNTPFAAGTPSGGVLTGNPLAVLGSTHALSATTYTSPAGNGSAYSFSSNNWIPGDYYQVSLPTTGYNGLSLSWDQARSGTGPASFKLQYSIGADFTDLFSYTVLQSGGTGAPASWNTTTYNSLYTNTVSLPALASNQSTLVLRFLNAESAASLAAGTNRIDNIVVTGSAIPVPAPLPIVGAAAAFGFSRRLRQRLQLARSRGSALPQA